MLRKVKMKKKDLSWIRTESKMYLIKVLLLGKKKNEASLVYNTDIISSETF